MDVEVVSLGSTEGEGADIGSLKRQRKANGVANVGSDEFETVQHNDKGPSLGPITPNPNRKHEEALVDSDSSSSLASSPPVADYFQSPAPIENCDAVSVNSFASPECVDVNGPADCAGVNGSVFPADCAGVNYSVASADSVDANGGVAAVDGGSPCTPRQGVFDPFAPGPDVMALAAICKKVMSMSMSKAVVVRRLHFDDFGENICYNVDVQSLPEETLLEAVYNSIMEVIITKQAEDFLIENGSADDDEPKTPYSPPRLIGVAETCPGAPMKTMVNKPWNIEPGLCRKLEF